MTSKKIAIAVKVLIYATFFVPLVVLPTSYIFPFIVPKILLFRSLTALIIAGYVLLLATNPKEYWPKLTPLSISVLLFLLSFTLSTFFGVDSYHSFWDNHERMLGLFTVFHYVAYFFICSQVFKTWTDWKWALRFFLLAGSVVMLIGCMQIADPNFLLNGGSPRIISTLGNAIYVGGYGLFLFFVASLLFLKENSIVWRWIAVLGGILALVGLFFSGTRGSMIGLLVGLAVAAVAYIFALKDTPRARLILISIVGLAVIGAGTLYTLRDNKFIEEVPALNRLLHTSLSEVTGGSARSIAWKIAFESWQEKPIFGWGPNNFFYAFNKHYSPESLKYGYGETWFDNAHNIVMNTMAVQGTFGIISYFSIFIVGIWTVITLYRKQAMDKHFAILTAAFLIAHLTQNVTVFENPTSYLYFMFWLALVNGVARRAVLLQVVSEDKKVITKESIEKSLSVGLGSFIGVTAVIIIIVMNIQPARANMKALHALQVVSTDPVAAIPAVEDALHFSSPHVDDIRNDVSHVIISAIADTNKKMTDDNQARLVAIVNDALESNLLLHPLDIRIHLSLSQMYQSIAVQKNSVEAMVKAEKYLQDALALSPKRQQIMYNLAIVDLQLGKSDQAIALFSQAISDNPAIAESYIRLGYTYLSLNKPDLAKATLERANQNGVVFTEQEQQSVNQIIAAFLAPKKETIPAKKK
jgi:O-antigen ligase